MIKLVDLMLEYSMTARKNAGDKDKVQCDQQLSSARLTGQAVIRAVEKQAWPETEACLTDLKNTFNIVTNYMKSIM